MLEDGAILVPTDAGADAIFDDQGLFERAGIEAGEGGGASALRIEPARQWIAGGKSAGLEVIGQGECARQPLSFPLLELERRQLEGCIVGHMLRLFRSE